MNLKPLILKELGVFYCHIYTHAEAASLYPCVSSFINITVDTRTKIQFIYLNNFKKLMTDAVYTGLKPKDKEYRESNVQRSLYANQSKR